MKIRKNFINIFKKGYPLLFPEALANAGKLPQDGTIVEFTDTRNKFVCRGYVGKQNKGLGWILTINENELIDRAFFYKKIKKAIEYRSRLFQDKTTNSYRIFNGEGDGIGGFTVDYLAGYCLINWYNEGIYCFSEEIVSSLEKMIKPEGIYQKFRFNSTNPINSTAGKSHLKGKKAPDPLVILENDVKLAIHLEDGPMIGVFLDQREIRKRIFSKYSEGKNILNTFSYTGAFSVFAALAGAKSTTSVDLAKRSLIKTKEQFSISEINQENNKIIVEDIFNYFKYAVRKNLKYDVIVLDPPSFARSKKFKFSISKDYPALIKNAIPITQKNGIIVASTNCATFGMKKLRNIVSSAFNDNQSRYQIIEEFRLPSDFRTIPQFKEGNYLKVIFIRVL